MAEFGSFKLFRASLEIRVFEEGWREVGLKTVFQDPL
jgi:hypothetical protein